jgi:hypothetical protein
MKIENDGHLCLHLWDLRDDNTLYIGGIKEIPSGKDPGLIRSFHPDARIAAAYARMAGCQVTFAMPGLLLDVVPDCEFFVPRDIAEVWVNDENGVWQVAEVKARTFRDASLKVTVEGNHYFSKEAAERKCNSYYIPDTDD